MASRCSELFCCVLFAMIAPRLAGQQVARAVDQKSGLFWDISYSGTTGTLQTGNYLLGDAWFAIPAGQSATVMQVGRYLPNTTTIDPSYTGPRNPAPGEYRDGTMKNPRGGGTMTIVSGTSVLTRSKTGYDNRAPGPIGSLFDVVQFQSYPLSSSPGDVLVSSVSQPEGATGPCGRSYPWETAIAGDCSASPTRFAAVLTCVSVAPATGTFRKPYSMLTPADRESLPSLTTASIDWVALPRVAPVPNPTFPPPTAGYLGGFFDRVWLDHVSGEGGTYNLFPTGHISGYGVWQRRVISAAAMLAMTNPDASVPNGPNASPPLDAAFRVLIYGMLQVGIDTFGLMQDDTHSFEGGGGHVGGRKFLVAFAAKMFGSNAYTAPNFQYGMSGPWTVSRTVNFQVLNDYPRFKEDQQFFAASNPTQSNPQQRLDWDWQGSPWKWGGSFEDRGWQSGPPAAWTPGQVNSESYRIGGSTPQFVGMALSLRMLGMESIWNSSAFLGGIDRYMIQEHPAVYPLYWNVGILPTNVQRDPLNNYQPIYGTGRYHREPRDQNDNNVYSQYPTFSIDMWNAYRWGSNQGTIEIKPNGATFEDPIDRGSGSPPPCPAVRNPVLLTQMRATLGATVLTELYCNESLWVPVTVMVAGAYYPAGLSLQPYFATAVNDAISYVSLTSAVSFVGLTNGYGYFGQTLSMPNDPLLVGTSFAVQAGVFDSAITCLATSNALLFTVEP